MRIVIDLQGAQTESRFRGIGRYSMSLAQAIVRNRGDHEVMLALSGLFPDTIEPIRATFYDLLPQEKILVWHAPGPVRESDPANSDRREAAEGLREAFLLSLKPDVVLITSLFEGLGDDAVTSIGRFDQQTPVATILHDLIPLISPDIHFRTNPVYKNYYKRKLDFLKKSSCLLANSESSRQEALGTGFFREERIHTISGACDSWFRPLQLNQENKEAIGRKVGVRANFLMYTGGADERKNLPRLISAYAALPFELRQEYQLLMVGKMPVEAKSSLEELAIKKGLRQDEVIFTGYVEDEELVKLYNACSLFVFPSLHEGLGLPPLEAMACGAPVIAARATSLPEIIGRNDALFAPNSETEITDKIKEVLSNHSFRKELIEHGYEQVRKFTWDESARRAIKALEASVPEPEDLNDVKAVNESIGFNNTERILGDLIYWLASLDCVSRDKGYQCQLASCIDLSMPIANRKRQLFIDISTLIVIDSKTGIQRVVRSVLKQLHLNPPSEFDVKLVYAVPGSFGYFYAREFERKFYEKDELEKGIDEPISFYAGDIFYGLDLAAHIVPSKKNFFALLRQQGVSVYFLLHDLLFIAMPQYFDEGHVVAMRLWVESVLENDGAICVSRTVAEELRNWVDSLGPRQRPFHISWVHNGADIENSNPSRGVPENAGLVLATMKKNTSFLTVATIEPRKGHRQTLDAFEKLWAQGINVNLVIVGKQGWKMGNFVDRIRGHKQSGKSLFWLEGISDEYLQTVYEAADCLIAASEGEGFGLPLIEAAQHKLPIIARDIPVFREVAGNHAHYFNGYSPDDLATAISDWLQLYEKREHPKSDNMSFLTWEQSAKQFMDVLLKKV